MLEKKTLICLLLVLALVFSFMQPASAAYITGDVAPEGVVYLTDQTPETEVLPDRIRYQYSFSRPDADYYWGTYHYTSESNDVVSTYGIKSYDFASTITLGSKTSSTSIDYVDYATLYPGGRYYYRLPCDASVISSSDVRWDFSYSLQSFNNYYNKPSLSYLSSNVASTSLSVVFYDSEFNEISVLKRSISSTGAMSGACSEDTFAIYTGYWTGAVIPENAVYFVPSIIVSLARKYISSTGASSTSNYYPQVVLSPEDLSFSLRFDVMTDGGTVDGIWEANDAVVGAFEVDQTVFFTCDGVSYSGMDFDITGSVKTLSYLLPEGKETVYVDQWYGDSKKTIDFGSQTQYVNSAWYAWFLDNFTRVSDSEVEIAGGSINIYDYGSNALIDQVETSLACIIYATATGIEVQQYSTGVALYSYTWAGEDAFAGFSLGSLGHVQYEVGTYYISMGGSAYKIYLYGENDLLGNGGSSGDSGSTGDGSGDSGSTTPTEPGGSGSSDSSTDVVDKEKDEANSSGNSALDDLTGAVPDYSGEFIDALDSFVSAFSYEGTKCVLMIPAVKLPGIDGLIPETEILPVSSIDFEVVFGLFPDKVILVVQSLLTIALIVYCFKELYDTISYFLTLKKGE